VKDIYISYNLCYLISFTSCLYKRDKFKIFPTRWCTSMHCSILSTTNFQ